MAQLLNQIDSVALDTEFNGIRVLSSAQTVTLQTGPNPGQTLVITMESAKTNDLGIDTVTISTMALAVSAISTIDLALQSVASLRSNLGAIQDISC